MSTILAVLPRKRTKTKRAPKLLVECAGCGCVYVTTSWKRDVLEQKTCTECRPRAFDDPELAVRARMLSKAKRDERKAS